jgi:hypothetical protein
MNKDFHYYCVAYLALNAGFSKKDSLTLAYASQYVDNSTESMLIKIGDIAFDPVRTAHYGLQIFNWTTQKRVFLPFHFLPPKPVIKIDDRFITEPASEFAEMLYEDALNEEDDRLRLYRLGIALHTYADTFTHHGFSGRRHIENKTTMLYRWTGRRWKYLTFENIAFNISPKIGHLPAGMMPDLSYLVWKGDIGGKFYIKENPMIYLRAAEMIYDKLCFLEEWKENPSEDWNNIKDEVYRMFIYQPKNYNFFSFKSDTELHCHKWRDAYSHLFHPYKYYYDKYDCRRDALTEDLDSNDVKWDSFNHSDFEKLHFPRKEGFFEKDWVLFHQAALKHRHFVIENLFHYKNPTPINVIA